MNFYAKFISLVNTMMTNFAESINQTFIVNDRYKLFLDGFGNTIVLSIFALLMGMMLGIIIALIKVTAKRHHSKFLNFMATICDIYTTVIRGTPAVLQLLILYFIVFAHSRNGVLVAIITFGINSSAYVSEVIRAGIISIDKGQIEAGRSLGLPYGVTMRKIVLPQAFKNILPALGNEFITLIKETAIVGYVGVVDLTKAADLTRSLTFDVFPALVAVALVYLAIVILLTQALKLLEKRLGKSDRD